MKFISIRSHFLLVLTLPPQSLVTFWVDYSINWIFHLALDNRNRFDNFVSHSQCQHVSHIQHTSANCCLNPVPTKLANYLKFYFAMHIMPWSVIYSYANENTNNWFTANSNRITFHIFTTVTRPHKFCYPNSWQGNVTTVYYLIKLQIPNIFDWPVSSWQHEYA